MEPAGSFLRVLLRSPPRHLLGGDEDGPEARARGPLFPRPIIHALLVVFVGFSMLTFDWFGLLLLNSGGVFEQIGALNALRVTAVLMAGIAVPSVLLMIHYRRIYTYTSSENVFFAITFSLSFMMGLPCGLVGFLG
ncbi:hypothetical protein RxyAA322_21650 [Rubrobacter xylanophilus]|uniref:Uncharacterized protein n=1 Tax=Rubrobacter xylanophilus TaxID=49319 RepID=A0A510HJW0_9ACTN|nr:hypothetical protein [Rubrobacter xylanophilus]BBL80311.1 hypothetical protein RxyAA322_21650 [Rubrobacter xylanophilus]